MTRDHNSILMEVRELISNSTQSQDTELVKIERERARAEEANCKGETEKRS